MTSSTVRFPVSLERNVQPKSIKCRKQNLRRLCGHFDDMLITEHLSADLRVTVNVEDIHDHSICDCRAKENRKLVLVFFFFLCHNVPNHGLTPTINVCPIPAIANAINIRCDVDYISLSPAEIGYGSIVGLLVSDYD
jgi:hypothetical protein